MEKGESYWALPGSYGWRRENRERVFKELRESLTTLGDKSPFVTTGLVGKSADQGLKNLSELEQFVPQLRWR